LTYTGADLTTIDYYINGPSGTLLTTLTLTYTAGVLQTVSRTFSSKYESVINNALGL
jgi:hypothetical protein